MSQTRPLESKVFTAKTLPIEYAEFATLGDGNTEMIQSLTSSFTDNQPESSEENIENKIWPCHSENETEIECEALTREEESVIKETEVTEALQLQDEECTIFDVFNALKRFIQGSISTILNCCLSDFFAIFHLKTL